MVAPSRQANHFAGFRIAVLHMEQGACSDLLCARLNQALEIYRKESEVTLIVGQSEDAKVRYGYNNAVYRDFTWKRLSYQQARSALIFAGISEPNCYRRAYQAPDDGIQQFCDCGLWIVLEGKRKKNVLPVRPTISMGLNNDSSPQVKSVTRHKFPVYLSDHASVVAVRLISLLNIADITR